MLNVALVGNPNTGKTTLYNLLSSSFEHVGNWHGVTVEEREKVYKYKDNEIKLIDLPGVYSLSPLSYEEGVSVNYLLDKKVDVVLNIADASNLKRNLYLTLSLLELGYPTLLVVNQIDKRPICKIDFALLERELGIKILHISAQNKDSINIVNEGLISLAKTPLPPPYVKEISLNKTSKFCKDDKFKNFYAIKILEDDENIKERFNVKENFGQLEAIAKLRYNFIDRVLSKCCSKNERVYGQSKLDKILLNRFLAIPIFLLIMAFAFYLTFFSLGKLLSDGLNILLDKLSSPLVDFLTNHLGQSWIVKLFQVALIGGVGSILTFLPQVALLFLFLSILEDSGYLSRVAFVFEDILSKVGLSGRGVYTLLMGFGCSTTAVMTARTKEEKKSKIKTSLLTPYMSCSAKFPIYSVLGGAFFGAKNIFVIFGLYFLGVVIAVLMSLIYEKTILKSKEQSFILEFPPYRMMNIKRTAKVLWSNVKDFLVRVGGVILAMNVIVFILSNFSFTLKYVENGGVSILETLGRLFLPIFKPIGIESWGLVSALFAGLIAKEVILSSIAMFNGIGKDSSLISSSIKNSSSAAYFSSSSNVLSYLVFCLLYFPCLASASVLGKEIGGKWLFVGALCEFIIAYLSAYFIYTFARTVEVFGIIKVMSVVLTFIVILAAIIILAKRLKRRGCEKCKKSCKKRNTLG